MTTSDVDNARFQELEALVTDTENKQELKTLDTAQAVIDWGADRGVDILDKSDVGKYVHKLHLIGVDLKSMWAADREEKTRTKLERLDEIADDMPRVDLWTAAIEPGEDTDDEVPARYAVVDATSEALWYGDFHPDDFIRVPGDPDSAEQSVAEKAVYLAGLAHHEIGLDAVRLRIHTQHPELDTDRLCREGVRKDRMVAVDVVVDEDNRAEFMANLTGFRSLKQVDLDTVIDTSDELKAEQDTEDDAEDEG